MKMETWIAALLHLSPRAFRERHGREVMAYVVSEWRRTPRRVIPVLRFWVVTIIDVLRSALRLRFGQGSSASVALDGKRRWRMPGSIGLEFRHAVRRLRQSPSFTIVVVLTLALGIGLNAAIFSVVDAVLFRSLPYRDGDRLTQIVAVWQRVDERNAAFSGGEFQTLREGTRTFEAIEAVTSIRQNMTGPDLPQQVQVGWVSHGFFRTLGVRAELGRVFETGDAPGTAMLGHDLWRTAFGEDPGVIGTVIRLDGHPYVIVGVVEPGMRLHLPGVPTRLDVWKVPDALWQNGDIWG
jgi:hypothetical protein